MQVKKDKDRKDEEERKVKESYELKEVIGANKNLNSNNKERQSAGSKMSRHQSIEPTSVLDDKSSTNQPKIDTTKEFLTTINS